eukprot:scaffold207777_cov77-Attheya_sp.AAC.1
MIKQHRNVPHECKLENLQLFPAVTGPRDVYPLPELAVVSERRIDSFILNELVENFKNNWSA